ARPIAAVNESGDRRERRDEVETDHP
ncbi:MAG: hypothetical protein QOD83_1887, partial [Solirubrobacteraceae bacterium]|nr:hypothetical protein [Solirubrobacteraceae bacterium]